MKSADSERDFNGFLRTVCVESLDTQKHWHRRQFMDTAASAVRRMTAAAEFWSTAGGINASRLRSKVRHGLRNTMD
jgi:hypothetical protein